MKKTLLTLAYAVMFITPVFTMPKLPKIPKITVKAPSVEYAVREALKDIDWGMLFK